VLPIKDIPSPLPGRVMFKGCVLRYSPPLWTEPHPGTAAGDGASSRDGGGGRRLIQGRRRGTAAGGGESYNNPTPAGGGSSRGGGGGLADQLDRRRRVLRFARMSAVLSCHCAPDARAYGSMCVDNRRDPERM